MRVAFQGETGAFSEEAAGVLYKEHDTVPLPSMEAVFEAVVRGEVDRGVIPIENSLFGSVHINYDHLRSYDVSIVGELKLRIRHCLMALPGSTLDRITSVSSHPQAIGQCQAFIRNELPQASTVVAYDTAGSAKLVAQSNDLRQAAIAPRRAATHYGLQILASNIESHAQNYTRFLALAQRTAGHVPTDSDDRPLKTSIVFAPRSNVPGALFKSLAVFFLRDLDLFKVESRPLVGSPGEYLFYLDVEGDVHDSVLQLALEHLKEISAELRVLGSYPRGRTWEGPDIN